MRVMIAPSAVFEFVVRSLEVAAISLIQIMFLWFSDRSRLVVAVGYAIATTFHIQELKKALCHYSDKISRFDYARACSASLAERSKFLKWPKHSLASRSRYTQPAYTSTHTESVLAPSELTRITHWALLMETWWSHAQCVIKICMRPH